MLFSGGMIPVNIRTETNKLNSLRFSNESFAMIVKEEHEIEDIDKDVSRKEIPRREILKAMNSINKNLTFTMELCDDC